MEFVIILVIVGFSTIFYLQLPITWLSSGDGFEQIGKMMIGLPIIGGLIFGLIMFTFQTKNLSEIPNPFVYSKSHSEKAKEVQEVSISEKDFKEFKEFQEFMKQKEK